MGNVDRPGKTRQGIQMRIHYLLHAPFEGWGCMDRILEEMGHSLTCSRLYSGEDLPNLSGFDALVAMGGPMHVLEDDLYPWLEPEKQLIGEAIAMEKPVLGICLGSQLIAAALGACVSPNPEREIGWHKVQGLPNPDGFEFPESFLTFHWHSDTFELPQGAVPLARSVACENQAFQLADHVLALQFHPEIGPTEVELLLEHGAHELEAAPFIQTPEQMRSVSPETLARSEKEMRRVLEFLLQ